MELGNTVVVRQPNSFFAIWDETTATFVALNLARSQAIEYLMTQAERVISQELRLAGSEHDPYCDRWDKHVERVRKIHGEDRATALNIDTANFVDL